MDRAEDRRALHANVVRELASLRSSKGELTLARFAECPRLVELCGDGDVLDAFLIFRGELQRWAKGVRNEAAYAWSVLATGDSVLDRLTMAAEHVPGGYGADQRTIRRWGDQALPALATQLVVIAELGGRRGRTLLGVEVSGDVGSGLTVVLDLMTPVDLAARSPVVSLWRFRPGAEPIETEIDLVEHPSTSVVANEYTMRRYTLQIESAWMVDGSAEHGEQNRLLQIDIRTPEMPSVTTRFADQTSLPTSLGIKFMSFRSSCQVTLDCHEM